MGTVREVRTYLIKVLLFVYSLYLVLFRIDIPVVGMCFPRLQLSLFPRDSLIGVMVQTRVVVSCIFTALHLHYNDQNTPTGITSQP